MIDPLQGELAPWSFNYFRLMPNIGHRASYVEIVEPLMAAVRLRVGRAWDRQSPCGPLPALRALGVALFFMRDVVTPHA